MESNEPDISNGSNACKPRSRGWVTAVLLILLLGVVPIFNVFLVRGYFDKSGVCVIVSFFVLSPLMAGVTAVTTVQRLHIKHRIIVGILLALMLVVANLCISFSGCLNANKVIR
jgi:hypothetical protein